MKEKKRERVRAREREKRRYREIFKQISIIIFIYLYICTANLYKVMLTLGHAFFYDDNVRWSCIFVLIFGDA